MKIYRDVFCSGHTSCHDLQSFQHKLNNLCIDEKWQPFDVNKITSVCYKLNPNEKDADLALMSNAIRNAPSLLFSLLCVLINAITMHGNVTQLWLSGTILPL